MKVRNCLADPIVNGCTILPDLTNEDNDGMKLIQSPIVNFCDNIDNSDKSSDSVKERNL
jgi:hypothetical protein